MESIKYTMLSRDDIIKSSGYECKKLPRGSIYDSTFELPDGCRVLIVNDFLEEDELNEYMDKSCTVNRMRGCTAFGAQKPRYEVSYTIDGEPNQYSGIKHYTVQYPDHVLQLAKKIQAVIEEEYGSVQLSTGIDIHYCNTIRGSGSIAKHSDDEMDWCAVAVYSLGQTRYLRVRRKDGSSGYYNIRLQHNSLVIMLDPKDSKPGQFQKNYTHQIDKLTNTAKNPQPLGHRLSLNLRFLRSTPIDEYM